MASTASLSTKLVRIGAALLVLALASISLTLWVTRQLEGGAAAVNEAGRMRMQTWRLTSAVQAQRPQAEVQTLVHQFDRSLGLLRDGDPARPLFVPWDDDVRREFADVERLWQSQRALWSAPLVPDDPVLLRSADAFVMAIDRLVLAIEHQLAGFTALLNLFQFAMMALAIAAMIQAVTPERVNAVRIAPNSGTRICRMGRCSLRLLIDPRPWRRSGPH